MPNTNKQLFCQRYLYGQGSWLLLSMQCRVYRRWVHWLLGGFLWVVIILFWYHCYKCILWNNSHLTVSLLMLAFFLSGPARNCIVVEHRIKYILLPFLTPPTTLMGSEPTGHWPWAVSTIECHLTSPPFFSTINSSHTRSFIKRGLYFSACLRCTLEENHFTVINNMYMCLIQIFGPTDFLATEPF